jgi:hypothetical protein
MFQPEALKRSTPWLWSPGLGIDVWAMFCACITGDLDAFNGNDTSGVTDASHLLGDSGQAPTCWSAAFARDVTPLSP